MEPSAGWQVQDSFCINAGLAEDGSFFGVIIDRDKKVVINSVDLWPGLYLHKAALRKQSITQMVIQIDPARGYAQWSVLIPITSVVWWVPHSMIFVGSIDECIGILSYVPNGLSSSMAKYYRILNRPFHASLQVSFQEEYLNTFSDCETRIPGCSSMYHITMDNRNMGTKNIWIDTAGMSVDSADIGVVMWWQISPDQMIATELRHISKAYWDPEVNAISNLCVDHELIILKETPNGSDWVDFDFAVSELTEECIWEFIQHMPVGVEHANPIATVIRHHHVDPPVL